MLDGKAAKGKFVPHSLPEQPISIEQASSLLYDGQPPELKGSPAQIVWASTIRAAKICSIAEALANPSRINPEESVDYNYWLARARTVVKEAKASFWIAWRRTTAQGMLKQIIGDKDLYDLSMGLSGRK